ncbi:hypothetical protein [Ottowia thiooxydans]|uniref:SMODS-associating 2TM beta-strand rich effector domain-containing protein n=1 Tax=Ottowia thiooxydans TaxID=219182 RepID=A0ABV2QA05_9BURK
MTPSAKFNALLASATVTIMFVLIVYVAPEAMKLSGVMPFALSVTALITSAGLYSLLSLVIRWLMERWDLLHGVILSAHYLHGTWIGWFDGHSNERRYMIEHFVQDLDGFVVTGRSFTKTKKEHGYWDSESTMLDVKKGRLVFTYKFDVLTQKSSLAGIHSSLLERLSSRHAPTGYSGLVHDLNDQVRIAVHSQKLSSKLVPWAEALAEAERRFGASTV